MVHYALEVGLNAVTSLGDGYTINLRWFQAYPELSTNKIAYHIYFSTSQDTVFSEGVKFISIDDALEINIIDLIPGQEYFFSVRPVEYLPSTNLSLLPISHDNVRYYPFSLLASSISSTALSIPLLDATGFPSTGVVRIGAEAVQYSSILSNSLILTSLSQRGYNSTHARLHTTDGYDGYYQQNPIVSLLTLGESSEFDRVYIGQCRFEYPNYSFTLIDGYNQVTKDILTSDLSISDQSNQDFPVYDYAGYHRTDPVQLLSGMCVGSYIGGEMGCIDGYGNVNQVRGMSLQDQNNQRQEILLNLTGRPAVLIKMMQTGIVCSCYLASSEYPDDRCPLCFGRKLSLGYSQFFNPRRSDGRILVRIGPTEENVKMYDSGLESEFPVDCWTLTVPTIKPRDIIVLFDQEDNEEFRYEVLGVQRNNTITGLQGAQHFKAARIRKTDIAYQIKIFKNTAEFPTSITTTVGFVPGIAPHFHSLRRNEHDPNTWEQLTSVDQGHNHEVLFKNGELIVIPNLGHSHKIII